MPTSVPDEIADVFAASSAHEDAPPLPAGVSADEAKARVEAFLEEHCSEIVDEMLESVD